MIKTIRTPIKSLATLPLVTSLAVASLATPAMAASTTFGDTKVTLGGYIKADVIYSKFSDGAVPTGSSRDFYVPHAIPTSDGSGEGQSYLDFHAKETRVWLKTSSNIDGLNIATHLEFDFISGYNEPSGDGRIPYRR